jgi:tetratricopeptide (TPR) repeat protein
LHPAAELIPEPEGVRMNAKNTLASPVDIHSDREHLRLLLGATLLVLAACATYSNSFSGAFVYDDLQAIPQNTAIHQLWPLSKVLFQPPEMTTSGRPLLSLSLAFNYAISGEDVWSYHLVNLLIHIAAGLTLLGLIRRTLLSPPLREKFAQAATPLATICALIWIVHPLQTQAVTYLVQRAESLVGLLYLLTVYWAARAMEPDASRRWRILAVIACALGMATKEVAATTPLLVLLYDRIFWSASWRELWRKRWPFYLALLATEAILILLMLGSPRPESTGFGVNTSPWHYLLTQAQIIPLVYLRLCFWPSGQALDYGWPVAQSPGDWLAGGIIMLVLLLGSLYALWKKPPVGYLGAWFFLILGPTSSLIPILDPVYEHRMYLSLAAVVVAVVLAAYLLSKRLQKILPAGPKIAAALAGGIIVLLGTLSWQRNNVYQSEEKLWQDNIAKRPGYWRPYGNLGGTYMRTGQYEKSLENYRQAARLSPNRPKVLAHLGGVLLQTCLDKNLSPDERTRRLEEAEKALRRSIELEPNEALPYENLGGVLMEQGRGEEATPYLQQAVNMEPENVDFRCNYAANLAMLDQTAEAILQYRQCIQQNPNVLKPYLRLISLYEKSGQKDQAVQLAREALPLAEKLGDTKTASQIRKGLQIYRQQKSADD